jgi:hypothetical protein
MKSGAERLGWMAVELFGLHPDAPMARYDRMGLIWLLQGEHVVALTATEARLSGLTFYRKGDDASPVSGEHGTTAHFRH